MKLILIKNTLLLCFLSLVCCAQSKTDNPMELKNDKVVSEHGDNEGIVIGASRLSEYLPELTGRVGVVANQTSVIYFENNERFTHLVDTLLSKRVNVVRVFAPEHGFRGTADAGEIVTDGIDPKTGLPVISLYGKNKKPSFMDHELDIVVFDIQDVGARFYTFISTLHYVMEACAEQNIPLIVLDRPNPNGHIIDGPVLEPEHASFVGMHPVPVAHGMTIGEYARMINGEGWLANGVNCDLSVIEVKNYERSMDYHLPIKPSPNLPNDKAINLYPSLCFFEGTNVSAGRGTDMQFQIFGSPSLNPEFFNFQFTPEPNDGAKYPKHKGEICFGMDLRNTPELDRLNLHWLVEAYHGTSDKSVFFNDFFTKLAGTEILRKQIESGFTANDISKSWIGGIEEFKKRRAPYLLYD